MHVLERWMTTSLLLGASFLAASCGGLAADEAESSSEEALSASQIVGAWKSDASPGLFSGLVFADGGRGRKTFFGEQFVTCVRAPCYPVRIEGRWTNSGSNLTLISPSGTFSFRASVSKRGQRLTLRNRSTGEVVSRLDRAESFCANTGDCSLQSWPHVLCHGGAFCTAQQTCGWQCGASRWVGYGDVCGGLSGIPCASGLECVVESSTPDSTGICRIATGPSCDNTVCAEGEHCELVYPVCAPPPEGRPNPPCNARPVCVADPTPTTGCAAVRCPATAPHCVEYELTGETACLPADQCATDADCRRGQQCEPEFVCIRAPCFSPMVCR